MGWTRPGGVLAACLALAACASQALEPGSRDSLPAVLAGPADAGVHDLRAAYRGALCPRLPPGSPPCDEVLLRLPGEGEAVAAAPRPELSGRYRIAFVPGLFSECFERVVQPFSDAQRALRAEGFDADYFRVSGRGTAAANADQIARQVDELAADPRPLIVFAYSKGLADTLEFLLRHPERAQRIAAIVSVAGAANGTPLAQRMQASYRGLAALFPFPDCAAGSGDEIDDLRPEVRLGWWRRNWHAVTVPVFALVAAPRPDRVSPATRATYHLLAQVDARNDGRLIWSDQIVPGGYLLGYANADHWAVVAPVAEAMPALSFAFRDGVPRLALVRAAIEVVGATLESDRAHAPASGASPGAQ